MVTNKGSTRNHVIAPSNPPPISSGPPHHQGALPCSCLLSMPITNSSDAFIKITNTGTLSLAHCINQYSAPNLYSDCTCSNLHLHKLNLDCDSSLGSCNASRPLTFLFSLASRRSTRAPAHRNRNRNRLSTPPSIHRIASAQITGETRQCLEVLHTHHETIFLLVSNSRKVRSWYFQLASIFAVAISFLERE